MLKRFRERWSARGERRSRRILLSDLKERERHARQLEKLKYELERAKRERQLHDLQKQLAQVRPPRGGGGLSERFRAGLKKASGSGLAGAGGPDSARSIILGDSFAGDELGFSDVILGRGRGRRKQDLPAGII